ncbi:hypothetical protein NEOLEDRAFT_1135404 [Neolentinus lepideus HHB14362 ss-1]|uniref:Early meiotic induction protein 1 n=1 Tax=Neolentinus lepideus HHB14362 ss-1 TaxID=1314782 RepID=A0A165RTC1_9AGAM|nr:hypothetical protein NEOLEDRAFT_1135404 [Neolentinus lepideus HHB14362 ss-1]
MPGVDSQTAVAQEEAYLQKVHPTPEDIPKCMTLFDEFLSCSGTKNQIKAIYRYGERASCSHKWEDFKFCMTLKALPMEERRHAWLRRRAEWWANRRLTQSSEDVWDIRTEPLQNWPPATVTDEVSNANTVA